MQPSTKGSRVPIFRFHSGFQGRQENDAAFSDPEIETQQGTVVGTMNTIVYVLHTLALQQIHIYIYIYGLLHTVKTL